MVQMSMVFDMRAPDFGTSAAKLYPCALDHAEWADNMGFHTLNFLEHHASTDGYLPSPIVMASAAAGRTKNCLLFLSVLLLPLHDPVMAAEELAVLDLLSEGRLRLIVGAGYREEEYAQFGLKMKNRPSLMERGIETLKKAWTGEPFDYEGRTVRVLPRPAQTPRPDIILGGASIASAKRAARIADGYQPIAPKFVEAYRQELERLGKPVPPLVKPTGDGTMFIHVTKDPKAAWQRILPHAMHETNDYAEWGHDLKDTPYKAVKTAEELKATGLYKVFTPEQCVEHAQKNGVLSLKPLMGGLDPDFAWESLRLIETEVLPHLRD